MTVGGDDDIALLSHQTHVPAVGEELADGALRSALTEEQCGVLLGLVEVRWEDDPDEHIATVSGLDPALLDGDRAESVEGLLILVGKLVCSSRLWIYKVEVGRESVALSTCKEAPRLQIQRRVVMHARGDLADLSTLECELPELGFGVLRGEEEDGLAVRRPDRLVDIVFEAIGEEGLLPRLELLDEEALQVSFVAITLHADPADLRSVGREAWVRVVASVALGDIAGSARSEVVEVDVGIRREGVLKSCLFAGGISQCLPVGTPGEFLRTTEGLGRSFIGFAF